MAKKNIPFAEIIIACAALMIVGFSLWYFDFGRIGNNTNNIESIEASDYSMQGIVREIKDSEIEILISLYKDGEEISEERVVLINTETEFYYVDPSTTPFTVSSADLAKIELGQEIIVYSTSDPDKESSTLAYKVDILR